ncbi:MAG: KH domain-containing protein [Chloroflexi bacterium]|nr:KH domain-containing protein [Chloroflexota bacterium]
MKDMVEYIAKALVRNPDAVEVKEEVRGNRVFITLIVDDEDKGKIIGRDGRVAQAIRSVLRVAAVKADQRIVLQID